MRLATICVFVFGLAAQHSSPPPSVSGEAFDGDPVNLSTGLYVRTDDDLSVEDPSLSLTRTYRTRDDRLRPFGIGVSHSYNLYLVGDSETFQWADLVLEDGGRIHFRRISAGRTLVNALYEHRESPTEFYGAHLQWNGGGWNIDLRDGGRYTFSACNPRGSEFCHLLAKRDAQGNEIALEYDAAGDLQLAVELVRPDEVWRLSVFVERYVTERTDLLRNADMARAAGTRGQMGVAHHDPPGS
jgi:hypothetical protein